MEIKIQPGFYTHFKHDPRGDLYNYIYEVLGIIKNTEDDKFFVLYRPLYKSEWMQPANYQSRPFEMFVGEVERDGKKFSRFTQITDPEMIKKLEEVRNELYS